MPETKKEEKNGENRANVYGDRRNLTGKQRICDISPACLPLKWGRLAVIVLENQPSTGKWPFSESASGPIHVSSRMDMSDTGLPLGLSGDRLKHRVPTKAAPQRPSPYPKRNPENSPPPNNNCLILKWKECLSQRAAEMTKKNMDKCAYHILEKQANTDKESTATPDQPYAAASGSADLDGGCSDSWVLSSQLSRTTLFLEVRNTGTSVFFPGAAALLTSNMLCFQSSENQRHQRGEADLIDTSMNRVELKTEINCSSFQNVCIGSVVELNANITTETDATFVKQLL
ncbi:hypothetical protein MJG53_019290 [Ovis ammon polii x Ovis aries]|uniref:Uncharacterized protein n=1 Tax=Ovis ammon polii x Ovis aries TaxID=2918886 RepID=A0ACB9U2S1_9CETA|nr:hypothetical protein MJG53_019290 [Ovis ammon polii x Ovis aries]